MAEAKAPPIDKRRNILDAAIKVFARQGFHSTRVSDIADEAGVAYGLVYHYFDSKDEVLNELFTERWSLLLTAIEEADASAESPRSKLAAVAAFWADQNRGVEGLRPRPLRDAPREQVDSERGGPLARGAEAGTVKRLGAGDQPLAAGKQVPLLRQGDELGAVGGGLADEALGRGEVARLLIGGVELYRGYPQGSLSIWMRRAG